MCTVHVVMVIHLITKQTAIAFIEPELAWVGGTSDL